MRFPLSSRRGHLPRPRLLPITIAVMSALLAVKSLVLVEAAANEATGSVRPGKSTTAPQDVSPVASEAEAAGSKTQQTRPASPAAMGNPSTADGVTPQSPEIGAAERNLLLDLRHRRETLDARARALDQQSAELDAAGRRISERLQELLALQTRLETLEAARVQHNSENWSGLVKTYEAMKPRDAAAIFDALDVQVLLQVLDRMQERRAAPVLAAMQPDRARLATQLLAEMRTRAVTPPVAAAALSLSKH